MTKSILVALSVLMLTACKTEFRGQVSANEPIKANVKKGQSYIPAGVSDLKLTIKSKKKAEIEVGVAGKKNNPVIPLDLRGSTLPQTSGDIVILGRNSGQPFDLRGRIDTRVERGPLRRGYETCQESVPVRRCHPGYGCDRGWEFVTGERAIEYYEDLYQSRIAIQVLESRNQHEQGQIRATDSWVERRVVSSSYCRVYGYPRIAF